MVVQVLGHPADEYPRNNRDAERYVGDGGGRYGNDQTRYKIAFAIPGQIALGKILTGETGDARYERYVAWIQDL